MSRARRHRPADDVDTARRPQNMHAIDGRVIPCCEEGEFNCPCACHDEPPPDLKLRPVDPPPEAA